MNETQKAKLESLRREIQKGVDDLEAGRFRDGLEVMAEFRERLLELKAERTKSDEQIHRDE